MTPIATMKPITFVALLLPLLLLSVGVAAQEEEEEEEEDEGDEEDSEPPAPEGPPLQPLVRTIFSSSSFPRSNKFNDTTVNVIIILV